MMRCGPTRYLATLPERVQRHLTAALTGDRLAAVLATNAADAEDQGYMVRAFYDLGIPSDAFQAALGTAWVGDNTHVSDAFDANRRLLNKAFRYAAFDLPQFLTRPTLIYRGGYGSPEDIAQGLSWTMDFNAACFFARRFGDKPEAPSIVVHRTVTSRSVLALFEHRNETEVVVAGVGRVAITCSRDEWARGAAEYEEEMATYEQEVEFGRLLMQQDDPHLYAATYGQLMGSDVNGGL